MNKVAEFYAAALADESAKAELNGILDGKPIDQAGDEQLEKIGSVAKKLGFEITVDEAKAYLKPSDGELDDDSLDEVAGGKGGTTIYYDCTGGIGNASPS